VARRKATRPAADRSASEPRGVARAGKHNAVATPAQSEKQELRPTALRSVFNGRTCLGHILSRGPLGFEAFDRDDVSLGVFATAEAAAFAIVGVG
jgi:hypothetical protein